MGGDILSLLQNVPEEVKERFITRRYDSGSTVIFPGATNDYLYILTEGEVEVCMQTYQGVNISLNSHKSPGTFGILEIFDKELKTKNVIAKSGCTIISLRRDYVLQWMERDFEFNLYVIGLLSECFRQANRTAIILTGLNIRERFLLSIYNHYKAGDLENLNKTILLQEVCAPLRSLNRTIAECIGDGLISYERKSFHILDEMSIRTIVNQISL